MQGRAKVHEKQANRRRSVKLGAAQSVHACSTAVRRIHTRSVVYSVHGRAKVQNCIGQKRMRCFQAARARDERFTQRQRFAAVLVCRDVDRRVLAHLCKMIEACKC